MMFIAAAAMAFTSCSKDATVDETVAPEVGTRTITVKADIDATRTALTENRTNLQWTVGDTFGVFTDVSTDQNLKSSAYAEGEDFTITGLSETATEIYAYYPWNSYNNSTDYSATAADIMIDQAQTQNEAGVLNGQHYPMVAKGTIVDGNVSMQFKPWACALALNIYGGTETEKVVSVTFTSDTKSSGFTKTANLTDPDNLNYTAYNATTSVTLAEAAQFVPTGTKPENAQMFENQVYLVVARATYPAVKFEIETTEAVYSYTMSSDIDCSAVDFYSLNVNLGNGKFTREEKGKVTGVYTWTLVMSDIAKEESSVSAEKGTPAMDWNVTLSGTGLSSIYIGSNTTNGVQIGKSNYGLSYTLTTNSYADNIDRIIVNASTTTSEKANADLCVYVGETQLGESVSLTGTATDYTFTAETSVSGEIKIECTNNAEYAVYLKSIAIIPEGYSATQLQTPEVSVNNTVLTWEDVENATGYEYTLDGGETTEETTSPFDVATLGEGTFDVQIRALGDDILYANSEWSDAQTVTVSLGTPEGTVVSSLDEITADAKYYLATNAGYLYTGIVSYLTATSTAATITDNNVYNIPDDAVAISLESTDTANTYYLKDDNGNYIYLTSDGTTKFGGATDSEGATNNWIFTEVNGEVVIQNSQYTSRYIRVYDSNSTFRAYSLTQAGSSNALIIKINN